MGPATARRRPLLAALVVLAALAGCDRPGVLAAHARVPGVPREEFFLVHDLCADSDAAVPPRTAPARFARGRRRLRVMLRAFRRDPSATVRLHYYSSDEPPGGYERVSVRRWLEIEREGLTEFSPPPPCGGEARRAIDAALRRS